MKALFWVVMQFIQVETTCLNSLSSWYQSISFIDLFFRTCLHKSKYLHDARDARKSNNSSITHCHAFDHMIKLDKQILTIWNSRHDWIVPNYSNFKFAHWSNLFDFETPICFSANFQNKQCFISLFFLDFETPHCFPPRTIFVTSLSPPPSSLIIVISRKHPPSDCHANVFLSIPATNSMHPQTCIQFMF